MIHLDSHVFKLIFRCRPQPTFLLATTDALCCGRGAEGVVEGVGHKPVVVFFTHA